MPSIEIIDKFERYESLKLQAKEIEKQLKSLAPELIEHIPEGGLKTHVGVFSVSSKPKWIYSADLQLKDKEIKERQKREQKTGIAEMQAGTPFVMFKANGDSDDEL